MTFPGKEAGKVLEHALHNDKNTFTRYKHLDDIKVTEKKGVREIEMKEGKKSHDVGKFDMVLLCPATIPGDDTKQLGGMLDLTMDTSGFFEELHGRMSPTSSKVAGVYFAGTCHGPKDIQQSISEGMAATAGILSSILEGKKMELEPIRASVLEEKCSGCKICLSVCPYKAISFIDDKKVSFINNVICQGCGTCVSACPSGVIAGAHFTNDQIFAEIQGVFS
jgi:heterodisulfide reductase subunit A